jgi:prephenate dehydrogenase
MIRRLCVIGVGLIGGSLARALREAGECKEVVGCSRDEAHLRRAVELGVIDRFETNISRAVEGADMVVVGVPLGAIEGVFRAIGGHLAADAVLTDVGSAKTCVIESARAAFGECPSFLVPGHPIAGTERSGVDASFASLFKGRRVILTPTENSSAQAVARVHAMWAATGAELVSMDPAHHDEVLAATSHLPHLLAYNLVDVLGRMEESREMFRYAAGGFRDFTRIASSDPTMWHDICLANSDAVLAALRRFRGDLESLERAIERGDGEELRTVFTRAKTLRDKFVATESS